MGKQVFYGYNSRSIYRNYSQSNFRCSGGWSNDKIEAVSQGRSTRIALQRERERGRERILARAVKRGVASRWISRATLGGMTCRFWRVFRQERMVMRPTDGYWISSGPRLFSGRCLPASVSAATEQLTDLQFFRFCENFARKGTKLGGFWIVEVADVEG